MKARLMCADRDVELVSAPEADGVGVLADLVRDLELDTLWDAMAGDDSFLRTVAQSAILTPLTDVDEIRYRQQVLADCLAHPDLTRELYQLAADAVNAERKVFRSVFGDAGESLLRRSIEVIGLFLDRLRTLRRLAGEHREHVRSAGFQRFLDQVLAELDDAYLDQIQQHLTALGRRDGVMLSARLGTGNRIVGHTLRRPKPQNRGPWYHRTIVRAPAFSFFIADRDESGFRALGELRDRGVEQVAAVMNTSAEHVKSFFVNLRREMGFFVGALNLHARLAAAGEPTCLPEPVEPGTVRLTAHELYDPCLALRTHHTVAGNELDADRTDLIIVTGANQGGKSTFLRSVGLAHLMMQAGLYVGATAFASTVTSGVFTHYKREEDETMSGGKFDEELARMSAIADLITPNALLLCNESFAATNEREGSVIAAEIIRAMTDSGVRVVFVTHLYDLAHGYDAQRDPGVLLLRADRDDSGRRDFRLRAAPPLATAYGEDLYRRTFGGAQSMTA